MLKNPQENGMVGALLEDALRSIERAIAALDEAGVRSDIAAHLDLARTLVVAEITAG
jgi:hypothetical protein